MSKRPEDTSPPRMWRYWREKYGHVGALEEHYPVTLARSPALRHALQQLKGAKDLIDIEMSRIALEDEEDGEGGF